MKKNKQKISTWKDVFKEYLAECLHSFIFADENGLENNTQREPNNLDKWGKSKLGLLWSFNGLFLGIIFLLMEHIIPTIVGIIIIIIISIVFLIRGITARRK